MVILAEEKQKLRSLLAILKRYLERKGLELNTEKSKVIRFKKGGKKRKKINRM